MKKVEAGSAQRGPAPGLEPEAARRRGACAEAERNGRVAHAGVFQRSPVPQHPEFQAQGRVRKSVERLFLPRPLIRYKPLPFPQQVPRHFPTVREERCCFVSGGI